MTTDARDSPVQITLGKGAMQNWADHALTSSADSEIARRLVASVATDVQSALVAGPHSPDFILALSQTVPRVSVLTRSIVDAAEISAALVDCDGVEVVAGSMEALPSSATYDLVISLDDFVRVASLEEEQVTWQHLLAECAAHLAPSGVLVVGCRAELGLDSLVQSPARPARNGDEDWAVDATFDESRPVTEQQFRDAVSGAGLTVTTSLSVYQSWTRPTVAVQGASTMGPGLTALLGPLCLVDEEDLHTPDHSRIAEAARRAGLLAELASGWFVIAREGIGDEVSEGEPSLDLVRHGTFARFTAPDAGSSRIRRDVGAHSDSLDAAQVAPLLLELQMRACADRDLPRLRALISDYVTWLRAGADEAGRLSEVGAAASPGNVLWSANPVVLIPLETAMTVGERVWRSLDLLVEAIVAKGVVHPWPAATEPSSILEILAAIAGVDEDSRPDGLGRGWSQVSAHRTMDPAVVDRLVEANAALASRANWFEERLATREQQLRTIESGHRRDLRQEQAKVEDATQNLNQVRSSTAFRAGRAMMSPARVLRKVVKRS